MDKTKTDAEQKIAVAAKKRILTAGVEAKAKAEAAAAPAPAEPAQAAETPERKVSPCDATKLKPVEFLRTDYLYTAYAGTRPDDLLQPEHFAHVSTQLRPRDRIEAWAHDGTWMANFVVLESGRNWARTAKLAEHYFTARDTAITQATALEPYEIRFAGPSSLWRVTRKADSLMLHDGEQTEDGARNWLTEHLKAFR